MRIHPGRIRLWMRRARFSPIGRCIKCHHEFTECNMGHQARAADPDPKRRFRVHVSCAARAGWQRADCPDLCASADPHQSGPGSAPAAEVDCNTARVIHLILRVGFEPAGHVPSGRMRVAGSVSRTRRRSSCRWPRRPPAAALVTAASYSRLTAHHPEGGGADIGAVQAQPDALDHLGPVLLAQAGVGDAGRDRRTARTRSHRHRHLEPLRRDRALRAPAPNGGSVRRLPPVPGDWRWPRLLPLTGRPMCHGWGGAGGRPGPSGRLPFRVAAG